jgi:hypothetical protein
MDDARHAYFEKKAAREWKYLILDFPQEHELSSKNIYKDAGEDEELKLEMVPIVYSHPQMAGTNSQHWAAWKVARTDLKVHKRGKVEAKESKSKGFALLQGLISPGAGGNGGVSSGMKTE